MEGTAVASAARRALMTVVVACALVVPGPASAADVCALLREHAPKDQGLALEKAVSVTPEFCQAWSADRKHTLLLRVMSVGNLPTILAGMRQSAVNGGNGTVADETGLGARAFSLRSERDIEITFGAGGNVVVVMFTRDDGFGDADADAARAFARSVAGALR